MRLNERQVEAVSEEIRRVAATEILPRFGTLGSDDIKEKSDKSLVTLADTESEKRLTAFLSAFVPGSAVIGEEGISDNPHLLTELQQSKGAVWTVDPVDGTRNFSAGNPAFGVMVALLEGGKPVHAWLHYPAINREEGGDMLVAERDCGLKLNGKDITNRHRTVLEDVTMAVHRPERRSEFGDIVGALRPHVRGFYKHASTAAETLDIVWGGKKGFLHCNPTVWDHLPSSLALREAGCVGENLRGGELDLSLTRGDTILFMPSRQSAMKARWALNIPARAPHPAAGAADLRS